MGMLKFSGKRKPPESPSLPVVGSAALLRPTGETIWDVKYNKCNQILRIRCGNHHFHRHPQAMTSKSPDVSASLLSIPTGGVCHLSSWDTILPDASFELKRKFHINKLLRATYLDQKSFFCLFLLVLIHCCLLIRATTAAATTTMMFTSSDTTSSTVHLLVQTTTLSTMEDNTVATAFYANSLNANNNNEKDNSLIKNNKKQNVENNSTNNNVQPILTALGEHSTFNLDSNVSHITGDSENFTKVESSSLSTTPSSVSDDEFAGVATSAADASATQRRTARDASNVPGDDDDSSYDEIDEYDALINNKSAKGKYIGAPCNDLKCEPTLLHVSCQMDTNLCGCDKNYPVVLGLIKGCDKPKKLGEQCFYDETCMYNDENSLCVQVRHNALCQCANGFHSVSYTKPTRRVFCTQDIAELTSDLPTLLGVSTGIAVLAGLICMVLHLFSKTKYPRHRNFGDANLPPPIMYSSDTGIPLTVQSGRPSSRSSLRSSGSIGSYGNRRSSSTIQSGATATGSKGILVSTSRTGSRRPSLASVHSTSSSVRSYSMMRFEKETQQREIRQEMKLRLARLQHQQHMSQNKPQIVIGDALIHHGAIARVCVPTPSPLTPNSMDELLPSVDETQEFPIKPELASTSNAAAAAEAVSAAAASYNGPCSSSTEAL